MKSRLKSELHLVENFHVLLPCEKTISSMKKFILKHSKCCEEYRCGSLFSFLIHDAGIGTIYTITCLICNKKVSIAEEG